MSQQDNFTSSPSAKILIPVVLTSVPLATGNSVMVGGREERVTGMRVSISTATSAEAHEVDLEFRFGGWWVA